VIAIAGAIGNVFNPRLLIIPVPLWSLLGASGFLLVTLGSALLRQRPRSARTKRVFLVISAFDQKHYVAKLVRNLHSVLDQRGYALELRITDPDYSAVGQLHCLRQVLEHKDDYVGGFVIAVIPQPADRMQKDLVDFCGKLALPVVFLDVEPFENEFHYPANSAFVGYSAAEIGVAAAGWVAEYLVQKQTPCPTVLVIGGDSQHQRQQRFKEELMAKLSPVLVLEDKADFDRLRARDVTRRQLKRARLNGQGLDVIFCTNDEMALGTVDGLLSVEPTTVVDTIVVGVDGTPQAKALIDAGPSPLRATVHQDSHKVAETGVDLLDRMIRKEQVPIRTFFPTDVLARD
jgi:ribose transport system substrate-binding protein